MFLVLFGSTLEKCIWKNVITYYNALVFSILEYGTMIWIAHILSEIQKF